MRRRIKRARSSLQSVFANGVDRRLSTLSLADRVQLPLSTSSTSETMISISSQLEPKPPSPFLQTPPSATEVPEQVIEMAAGGRLVELRNVLTKYPHLLKVTDDSGRSLLHVAAENNTTEVMELLLSHGLDINEQDDEGNAPLHLAVLNDQAPAAELLLANGCDSTVQNYDLKAPVHMAAFHNCAATLDKLLIRRPDDKDLIGERGFTVGHYCAMNDSAEAFDVLMKHNGSVSKDDWYGQYPIHVAIKNLSVRLLTRLVKHAESTRGESAQAVMNMKDNEGNVALHTAVNTGDVRCVQLCLDNGADISVQQDDASTPLHYACTKGELELVRLMLHRQPDQFARVIVMKDSNGRTPLHRAAFFNHHAVVRLLVAHGADIEATDDFQRTPLLLAAFSNAIEACNVLMESGADSDKTDINGRNVFHLLVLGCNASCGRFRSIPKFAHLKRLVNDKDIYGCSPLHYATKKGLITSTDTFLELGANCFVQNNEDDTPLHFAARFGRIHTCQRLLDSGNSGRVLNCMDSKGYLPIHAAAENGHTKTLQLLLDRGSIFQKTFDGDTPLHLASANGHLPTVELLLNVNPSLLNASNKFGKTALHLAAGQGKAEVVDFLLTNGAEISTDDDGETFITYAIEKRHVEVAQVAVKHDRWQELLLTTGCSPTNLQCPVLGFVEEMPDLAAMAFNRCLWSNGDPKANNYTVTYDFSILSGRSVDENLARPPLNAIKLMVDLKRVELLKHPVCETYLAHKWLAYGKWMHLGNLFIYLVFIVALSFDVLKIDPLLHFDDSAACKLPGEDHTRSPLQKKAQTIYERLNDLLLVIMVTLNIVKELVQMYQQRARYFADLSNYSEWALYLSVAFFVLPRFAMHENYHFQYEAAAVAMLIAFMNLLLFFKRFEMFGIYVVMFLEISSTLFKALTLFIILILGFAFSFYVLLQYPYSDNESTLNWPYCYTTPNISKTSNVGLSAWKTPQLAVIKTLMMMMGEYDYLTTFINTIADKNVLTNHFSTLTFVVLLVFIFFIPILLMNLLIGLAVGDIESVRRNAALKRIAMQVEWYIELETKMPTFARKALYTSKWVTYPHRPMTLLSKLISLCPTRRRNKAEIDDKEDVEEAKVIPVASQTQSDKHSTRLERMMMQQKDRILRVETQLDKQTNLLRLIMQKMEIHAESEEKDEGMDLKHQDEVVPVQVISKWKKLQANRTLIRRTSSRSPSIASPSTENVA